MFNKVWHAYMLNPMYVSISLLSKQTANFLEKVVYRRLHEDPCLWDFESRRKAFRRCVGELLNYFDFFFLFLLVFVRTGILSLFCLELRRPAAIYNINSTVSSEVAILA